MIAKERASRIFFMILRIGLGLFFRGLDLSCICLGVEREVTNYPFEVAWRLVLFLAMLAVWYNASRRGGSWFKTVRLDFSEI